MSDSRYQIGGWLLAAGAFLWLVQPSASSADEVRYGRFGERTLGRPFVPRTSTRFSRGVVRSPSGSFLGVRRSSLFPTIDADDPRRRSSVPEDLPVARPPATGSLAGSRELPPVTRRVPVRRTPIRVQPDLDRGVPADIWFRNRTPRRSSR